MTTLIDIDVDKKKAINRYKLHIVVVILIIVLSITGLFLSLFLSSLDYVPNLIINIVISTLLVIFLVFYFLNVFPIVKNYYSFYKNISPFALEKRRDLKYLKEINPKIRNNTQYRVLQFSYKEGEEEFIENLYILDNDFSFKEERRYNINSYRNVIVSLEEITYANN